MIIKQHKWRKLLMLPSWSIHGEWLEELNQEYELIDDCGVKSSSWTGIQRYYKWSDDVEVWLAQQPVKTYIANTDTQNFSDWVDGQPNRIWVKTLGQVVMFKMIFGGKKMPENVIRILARKKRMESSRMMK